MFPKYPLMDEAGDGGGAGGTYTPPETPPKAGEEGYDEYMAYVGEHGLPGGDPQPNADVTPPAPAKAERPDYVPEKFWDAEKGEVNVEGLAKSYGELERTRGQPPKDDPAPNPDPNAAPKGIDFKALGEHYLENGELTQEHYTALEASGLPKDLVDAYLDGQQALAKATVASAYDAAGGKEKYDAMMAWARANKSEADLDKFDASLSKDIDTVLQSVKAMSADYTKAVGHAPNLVEGDGNVTGDVFNSQEEVVAAMNDPRYAKDPAYRAAVIRKLAKNDPFAMDAED
jgi:hypothetical protein